MKYVILALALALVGCGLESQREPVLRLDPLKHNAVVVAWEEYECVYHDTVLNVVRVDNYSSIYYVVGPAGDVAKYQSWKVCAVKAIWPQRVDE